MGLGLGLGLNGIWFLNNWEIGVYACFGFFSTSVVKGTEGGVNQDLFFFSFFVFSYRAFFLSFVDYYYFLSFR